MKNFLAALLLAIPVMVGATPPDLTSTGAIAALKAGTLADAYPTYGQTYNLGATGLRGWIFLSSGWGTTYGGDGTMSNESRQILVTVAAAPANAALAVDDVILGAMAASSGTVPNFSSDCRKAFGTAITDAEKTGAGTLRVKRWRKDIITGTITITDVNIPMTIMGDYTATAPYTCDKSAAILADARNKLVSQLYANENFLTNDWAGAISGLAMLASVAPGYVHPTLVPTVTYDDVQTRLRTYARTLAAINPIPTGTYTWNWNTSIWNWSYIGLFLSEYYLSTNDAQVVTGVNNYTVALASAQSRYGTYGHGGAVEKADGSLHGTIPPYGPVNSAGIPANIAIVIGKKALLAASQPVNPEIDPAIQRGSDFFAWFVNKGSIPYGEHEPWMGNHESNGKDPMCAVFFGLQANRTAETEYFTRMSVAAFNSRESGHTGQGFSYLWGAMGANMGGSLATAEYLKSVRWHADLARRTDGSIGYDGAEQYGGGSTADGTYLGASSYFGMNSTAMHLLTYSLPLQRLYITGKNAIPANTLDSTKVAHAVSSATFKQDSPSKTNGELITALSDFDPIVRHFAAIELGKRSPSSGELTTLRGMVTGTDANGRMGACQTLGYLKDTTALSLINQRIDKNIESNSWVRAKAAAAIREYPPATASVHRDSLLATYVANATDPEVIVWDDPVQISNNQLFFVLFGDSVVPYGNNIASYTINAPKNLLYPAVKTSMKQPDSYTRTSAAQFCYDYLTLPDVQELALDIFEMISTKSQADTMWHSEPQTKGIQLLVKHKCAEGLPLALSMMDVHPAWGHGSAAYLSKTLDSLATYGDSARWIIPFLNEDISTLQPVLNIVDYQPTVPKIESTIAAVDSAITSPGPINHLLPLATPQVVSTTGAKAVTLTGTSPRSAVTFTNVTAPAHGTLSGIPPNVTYTPAGGYTGPDSFTFQVIDSLGAANPSAPGTVAIIVGTAGSGLKGEYFGNADFTGLQVTRTDPEVNFDWGSGSPDPSVGADTFSVRWSGLLLVPETGTYSFSTLNSDGVRLFVNGVAVIDQFADQSTHWNDGTSINLTEGQLVELQMDYYENTGSAVGKLKWTGPSFAGVNGAIIGSQWLFDGAGMSRTPYAHAQTVTLVQNTSQPITLSGGGGTLTYTVLTPPAHGALTGTAPYLTYTPAANYNGSDSFTFRVNNGTSDSAPATVSIGISAGATVGHTWLTAASGNLSGAGHWVSGTAPAVGGLPTYNLNLTPSGTYTVTHDLNHGFQLNQLNLAGAVTLAGTNSLAFTANGFQLPQINQNSASAVTINTPLSLSAMTTFGGTGAGTVTINSLISGTGGLTKNGSGSLRINYANNTYSGGTIINAGQLALVLYQSNAALGTGPVTLNGGQIYMDRINCANALTVNGGNIYSENGFGNTWSGPVTLNTTAIVNTVYNMTFSGNISGAGGFAKSGNNTLVLSGNNSFTGANSITAGILSCTTATSLGTGSLSISAGGKAALNYTGNRNIASLILGGTPMPAGTYGSTSSSATNKNDTYFSGTGMVTAGSPNIAPVASAQSVSTAEDTAKPITLSATDANGNPLTYAIVTKPAHGTLSGTAPNVTYTPVLHYSGADSFTFKANDGTLDSASATVSITVTAVNDAPMAAAQSVTTAQGVAKAIALTGTDVEGSALTYAIVVPPAHGTLSGTPPNVTYTPNAGYSGFDGFTFKANDGALDSTPAPVSINVTANNTPVATPQSVSTAKNTAKPITLAGTDVEGSSLTCAIVTNPAHGTLSGTPPNVTFTPTTNYTGPDSFTFKVNDGTSDSAPATVSITVTGASTAVPLTWGAAMPITNATDIQSAGVSNLAGTDFGRTNGTTTIVNNGSVNVSFVSMLSSQSAVLPNGITVSATGYNFNVDTSAPAGVTGTYRTVMTKQMGVTGAAGNIILSGLTVGNTYQIQAYISGSDAHTSTISGSPSMAAGGGNSPGSTAGFGKYVVGTFTADAPSKTFVQTANTTEPVINALTIGTIATGGSVVPTLASIVDDRSGGPVAPNTLVTCTVTFSKDMDASTVSAADFGNAGTSAITIGTITETTPGVFTVPVTPTSAGTIRLKVNVGAVLNDATGNAMDTTSAIIDDTTITVTPVNTAPVANSQSVITAENTALPITLTVSDAELDQLTYILINGPAHGTLSGTAPNVTYTPVAGYSGPDSFTFKVNDGILDSAAATVGISVTTSSTTALVSSPVATGPYGSTASFTATVTAGATGTVTFTDGVTVLGTVVLSSGTATFATSTLAVANHSIIATYGGDSSFGSSVSAPSAYLVTAKALTITGVTASDKVYDGNAIAALTGGTVSGGVVGGETVTVVSGSGTFASPNAGTWAVTASGYALGGANAGNYTLSGQPTVPNATITARPVELTGTRVYDGTVAATAGVLSISNNLDGANLTLAGSATLAAKDVGSQGILTGFATPVRVRSATGFSSGSSSTSFTVTMGAAPATGNTLVAAVSSRGTAADRVTGVASTGATWARVAQSVNSSGSTTEIWSAPVGASAAAGVTISTVAGRCAGVVIEYSGLLTANAVDQTAASPGATSSSPLTGTTPITTQANELWIGGIGYRSSSPTLSALLNSFASVASAQSNSTTAASNAKVYALESIVSATGTAGSGGTLSASVIWSGAIATFKAASTSTLALTGSAAGNYTLTGMTGAVTITPKALAVTGLTASSRVYDGTSVALLSGTAALLTAEAAGAGTTSDGKPYTGDTLAVAGTAVGTFGNPNVGTAKAVTVGGLTLSGAGSGNYTLTQTAGLMADITRAPTTITTAPTATAITYGQTLASSTLSGGVGSVPGSFAFTAPATQPSAGTAPHSVTFSPSDTTNYQTATTSVSVTVNAAQTNFAAWAAESGHGLTAGVNDGPLDDPDRDGSSNLMEYALNTAPAQANPAPVTHDFATVGDSQYLRLNAVKNPQAGDLDYIFEVSSDLAANSWSEVPTIVNGNILSGTDTAPTSSSMKRFIRLKIRISP
jgi:autotransporter-associated beta strand protein